MLAALHGQVPTLELLLSHHAKLELANRAGQTALIMAAKKGHRAVCEKLLAAKPYPAEKTAKDKQGLTASQWAAKIGNAELAALLKPVRECFCASFFHSQFVLLHAD